MSQTERKICIQRRLHASTVCVNKGLPVLCSCVHQHRAFSWVVHHGFRIYFLLNLTFKVRFGYFAGIIRLSAMYSKELREEHITCFYSANTLPKTVWH